MSTPPDTRSIIVERFLAHPVEHIWRALTEGELLAQWLMPGDFQAVVGRPFTLRVDPVPNWSGVTQGEVLDVKVHERLVYRWHTSGAAQGGLTTTVTWTLLPTDHGVLLRMEQSGFRPQDDPNLQGATRAWGRFLAQLERLLTSLPLVST
jgi:uncharacterized protein YndB with AHSA1/START domain